MGALLDLALESAAASRPRQTAASLGREQRVEEALRMLREGYTGHAAFVAGEPVSGSVPVSVVIQTVAGLVAGELEIPTRRWDPWLFLRFLHEQDERKAS
jgi:hypothetical protein